MLAFCNLLTNKSAKALALILSVTRNEILTTINKPEDCILAVGQVKDGEHKLVYVRQPFEKAPEFAVASINYKLQELPSRGQTPG